MVSAELRELLIRVVFTRSESATTVFSIEYEVSSDSEPERVALADERSVVVKGSVTMDGLLRESKLLYLALREARMAEAEA